MLDRTSDSDARMPSLYLEYGADEGCCEQELEICERGMCFQSHWQFSSGTEMGVSFRYHNGEPRCARLSGIVVDCQPAEHRSYRVTVLFLDVPEALLETLRDVSSLLEPVRKPVFSPLPNKSLRK